MRREKNRPIRPALLIAGVLAVSLSACDKEEPPKAAPPATVVQPAATPEPKPAEAQPVTSAPAPMPAVDPNAELAGKVKAALRTTPGLEALAVDVVAADGVVTLFGTADGRESIQQAGKAAAGVPGVKSVQNKLVIVRGS